MFFLRACPKVTIFDIIAFHRFDNYCPKETIFDIITFHRFDNYCLKYREKAFSKYTNIFFLISDKFQWTGSSDSFRCILNLLIFEGHRVGF